MAYTITNYMLFRDVPKGDYFVHPSQGDIAQKVTETSYKLDNTIYKLCDDELDRTVEVIT